MDRRNRFIVLNICSLVTALFVSAVDGAERKQDRGLNGFVSLSPIAEGHEFGYEGDIGSAHWGEIDGWELCQDGLMQSPVDLSSADIDEEDLPDIQFQYHQSPVSVVNNGHTIQFNYRRGSSIRIGDDKYELIQFHFHTPSEHTRNGEQSELELHLVHRSRSGDLAVIGVFIEEGEEANETFGDEHRIRQLLPCEEAVSYRFAHLKINAETLLPQNRCYYYTYRGSLTTPPCSEGVRWIVLKESLHMSRDEIDALQDALHHLAFANSEGSNARPTLPLNGRKIRSDNSCNVH